MLVVDGVAEVVALGRTGFGRADEPKIVSARRGQQVAQVGQALDRTFG
jgi:hypothetical protein